MLLIECVKNLSVANIFYIEIKSLKKICNALTCTGAKLFSLVLGIVLVCVCKCQGCLFFVIQVNRNVRKC